MLYYRYRPWSDISIKELLYNEIYFSSADESNDPYEGKKIVKFKRNKSKWRKIFLNENIFPELYLDRSLFDKVVNFFCSREEWTLKEILSLKENDFPFFRDYQKVIGIFVDTLKYHFTSVFSFEKYFVSFSKNRNNTAMWSYYASRHEGFCLIFNFKDNKIKLDPQDSKKGLLVKGYEGYPNSIFAKSIVSNSIDLCDVNYVNRLKNFDGFLPLTDYYKSKEAVIETYLQKSKAWKNEEECRILLGFDGKNSIESKWSKNQRLFHYDFNQLVGIILGYRMEQEGREQIIEIIKEKICKQPKESGFCIFEAELSKQYQKVNLKPSKIIISHDTAIDEKDPNFQRAYEKWKNEYPFNTNNLSKEKKL